MSTSRDAGKSKNNPDVAYSTAVIGRGCEAPATIKVEADEFFLRLAVGGKDRGLTYAYFDNIVNRILDTHRLQGLSLAGVVKISFTRHRPESESILLSRNQDLWERLQSSASDATSRDKGWYCMEDERCQCSWCVEIDPIVITA